MLLHGIIPTKSKKDLPAYLFNLSFDSKVKELYIKNSEKDIIVNNKIGIMYISIVCPPHNSIFKKPDSYAFAG